MRYRLSLIESKFCCANQAGLPGLVGLLSLNILCVISWVSQNLYLYLPVFLTKPIGNLGLFSLNTLIHTRSKQAATKKPTPSADIVNKNFPSVKFMNGIKIQQLKNLISRTLGKNLAYWSNCSEVISHSFGTSDGKMCHILSFILCNFKSIIKAIIGYIKIKNAQIVCSFQVKRVSNPEIKTVMINFGSMAINPEQAITLGLLKNFWCLSKKFSNCMFKRTPIEVRCIFNVAQNLLNPYGFIISLAQSPRINHV